jgi:hypothetical protein
VKIVPLPKGSVAELILMIPDYHVDSFLKKEGLSHDGTKKV